MGSNSLFVGVFYFIFFVSGLVMIFWVIIFCSKIFWILSDRILHAKKIRQYSFPDCGDLL
jgi:hypothetical protein